MFQFIKSTSASHFAAKILSGTKNFLYNSINQRHDSKNFFEIEKIIKKYSKIIKK